MLLQLSSLADNDRDPGYTEAVLNALHEANPQRHRVQLEYGMHAEHVGLFCRCPASMRNLLTQQIADAYPSVRITELPEQSLDPPAGQALQVLQLRLQPDALLLRTFNEFEDLLTRVLRDPVSGLLSLVRTGRSHDLHSRISISIRPASSHRQRHAKRVLAGLQTTLPLKILDDLYSRWCTHPAGWRRCLAYCLLWSGRRSEQPLADGQRKLQQHLFETHIQLVVATAPGVSAEAKLAELLGAFGQFTSNRTQFVPYRLTKRVDRCRDRGSLLSAAEVATLWHPVMQSVRVDRMTKAHYRELEPPALLPSTEKEGTDLGRVAYRSRRDVFQIRTDDRMRHCFCVGKTGQGKTTLMANMVASDIAAGRGVCLIDPHGDLAESVLAMIPKHRTNDVVYFDAADKQQPVAFNPLELREGSDATLVVDGVLSAFQKVFDFEAANAPRMMHIFNNCLLALVGTPGATLISLQRILQDAGYRKQVLSRVDNPAVLDFWHNEYAKWNERDRTQYIASLQNKLGGFLSNPTLQGIFGQSHGTIDLRHIMDAGQVLIVNLSKGRVGENASSLLGSLLVSSLQIATLGRADVPEAERRDFFAYVDEFQNFTTESFTTMLSEARKYRLSLTLANQYLTQIEEQTLAAVVGNVGSLISFQVGADDAEFLARQLACDITPDDLMNLPKYHAYIRLLVDGVPATPFSMSTLEPRVIAQVKADHVRRVSRERYGRPRDRVLQEVRRQYAGGQ